MELKQIKRKLTLALYLKYFIMTDDYNFCKLINKIIIIKIK